MRKEQFNEVRSLICLILQKSLFIAISKKFFRISPAVYRNFLSFKYVHLN
jgi:hypothetical protein